MADGGKRVLVTGANAGIGKAAALELARAGAVVLMVSRDKARGEAARDEIAAQSGSASVRLYLADLSLLASVRQLAATVQAEHTHLDVLVNCAAVYKSERVLTPEGIELMFATNHLAYFLLTTLLLDLLQQSGAGRILNVSAPATTPLSFDDLNGERRFNGLTRFGATKLANLLFTLELARRLEGSSTTVNALHPGVVRSGIMREANPIMRLVTRVMSGAPEQAGQALAQAALAPEFAGKSGRFLHKGREIAFPALALDRDSQQRLWAISTQLTQASQAAL